MAHSYALSRSGVRPRCRTGRCGADTGGPLCSVQFIQLSREHFHALIYPAVIENRAVGKDHAMIRERLVEASWALWAVDRHFELYASDGKLILGRALKLQNYFTQPLFIAEPYTKRPGTTVRLADSLQTCRDILDGRYDHLPIDASYFSGDMAEIRGNVADPFVFPYRCRRSGHSEMRSV